MRNWIRPAAVVAVVTAVVALFAIAPPQAQSSTAAATSPEIGVSPTEIHVAVIADVDNPFSPGVFQPIVDGVKGAASYLNSKAGGGGIGGRKLVVDFIDSQLNASQARNAVISACQQDFALVGTAALFLTSADDEISCADKTGTATGLPDLGAVVTGIQESCSPVSFPVNATQIVCATKDQHPQTYKGNQGDTKYLLKTHKSELHGAMVSGSETADIRRAGGVLIGTATNAGVKADQSVHMSGRDPQSAYTPIVNEMKNDSSNYAFTSMASNAAMSLRSEAALQGLTSSKLVWECTVACYDNALKTSAQTMDGEYFPMSFLPFEEASSNPMVKTFLQYVGGRAKAKGITVSGWTAMLAFAQAARAVVAKDGVNGLTRSAFLKTGVPTLTKFDADGMIGVRNIAAKTPTPCFMMEQFKNGNFVRVYPAKKGTFDCAPSNRTTIKADLG